MRPNAGGIFWSLFLLLFAASSACASTQLQSSLENGFAAAEAGNMSAAAVEMVPMGTEEMMIMVNESRRRLGSFQICALCTCCGGRSRSYCLASPCCYAINCNIPNRPFGFCSFTPKTCNCFGCHL